LFFFCFNKTINNKQVLLGGKERERNARQQERSPLKASERNFAKGRRFQARASEGTNFDVKMPFFVPCRIGLISTWNVEVVVVVAHFLHSLHDPLIC
jgi:hypothetical protein